MTRRNFLATTLAAAHEAAAKLWPAQLPPPRVVTPRTSSPAEALAAAVEDAKKVSPAARPYTRYLSLHHVPVRQRADYVKWLTFWLWSVSSEAEPGRPRGVSDNLVVAINTTDYGEHFATVYGRLPKADPYFHSGDTYDGKKPNNQGQYAFFLPDAGKRQLAELLGGGDSLCLSGILRLDWLVVQMTQQDGRGKPGEGFGYYDFLNVKNRADFQKLIGYDAKLAAVRKAERRAIVERSGVANFPRQLVRDGAVDSGYWFTLDVLDDNHGERNALRNLDADFKHQAEEHYGVGPSGLFAFLLTNDKGELQDAAPDKIGPDSTRQGRKRTRIEVGTSCVRCHVEGLRPIDDWSRENIRFPDNTGYDAKLNRHRQLYARELASSLDRDNLAYAARLKECNGLTPQENAALHSRLWDAYVEARLTTQDCAGELGVTAERLVQALSAVAAQGKMDGGLAPLLRGNTIRRDVWEEVFPAAMLYLGGSP